MGNNCKRKRNQKSAAYLIRQPIFFDLYTLFLGGYICFPSILSYSSKALGRVGMGPCWVQT